MSNEQSSTLRLTLLTLIMAGLLVALISRLWFLQVLAGERFAQLAESNRVRFVVLEAPRGRILADDGQELVKNRPAQTISAHPRELLNGLGEPRNEEAEAVLGRLSMLLGLDHDEIIRRLLSRRYSPFRPVPIAEDVGPEVIFAVTEHQELFRGVVAETLPVRTYPFGTAAAHAVGYLGEISEEELELEAFAGYRPGDLIGWAGLEKTYESELHGTEGLRKLEVNASGTVLQELGRRDPIRGNDVQTTLDVELQEAVERILQDGIEASRLIKRRDGRFLPSVAGSAVVLDPRDGGVKAIVSWPTFDPAEFVGGVSHDYWGFLNDGENQYPLINRAIQSTYPPGSVFKTVSGSAAMIAGHVTPSTRISCPPAWSLGGITFRNWNTRHEGALDLTDALMRSCDTYFYQLAYDQWLREQNQIANDGSTEEVLQTTALGFGFGRTLGIDLPSERPGVIPGREWRLQYWERTKETTCRKAEEAEPGTYAERLYNELCQDGFRWRGGDAVNSSIGQGDVLVTPLQVAASYAAIANGGTLIAPHLGDRIIAPDGELVRVIEPEVLGQLPVTPEQLRALQVGLEKVVMNGRGTARGAFAGFPTDQIPVAGKTGTAELKPKVPYAWFAAYAPANDPQYVVVVSVEQGGGGSQTAAPIARRILEVAFGLEETPFREGPRTD